jgi:hypothetical protein
VRQTARHRVVLMLTALTLALALTPVSSGVASADTKASGGGCGGWQLNSNNTIGSWRSCISATSPGRALPDGYLRLRSGHVSCWWSVAAYRVGGGLMSYKTGRCPSGYWQGRAVGIAFSASSGRYYTVVEVNDISAPGSPPLTLP